MAKAADEGEAIAAKQVFKSFTEPTVETVVEDLPDGSTKVRTITRPPDAGMALRWLERRAGARWNLQHRLAVGQDADAPPITFYLPHNERDATPALDGGAPGAPTDSRP